jgi:hypothetical protein
VLLGLKEERLDLDRKSAAICNMQNKSLIGKIDQAFIFAFTVQ